MKNQTDTPASDMILARVKAAAEMIAAQSRLSEAEIEAARFTSAITATNLFTNFDSLAVLFGTPAAIQSIAIKELELKITAAKLRVIIEIHRGMAELAAAQNAEVNYG